MRDLSVVIDKLIEVIPSENTEQKDFIRDLQDIKWSVRLAAPEMTQFWWLQTQEVVVNNLCDYVGNLKDWQVNVVRVWTNDPNFKE